jgi:hypothetical protein
MGPLFRVWYGLWQNGHSIRLCLSAAFTQHTLQIGLNTRLD